jgi:ABC-type multidrug transport system ATPase subunit
MLHGPVCDKMKDACLSLSQGTYSIVGEVPTCFPRVPNVCEVDDDDCYSVLAFPCAPRVEEVVKRIIRCDPDDESHVRMHRGERDVSGKAARFHCVDNQTAAQEWLASPPGEPIRVRAAGIVRFVLNDNGNITRYHVFSRSPNMNSISGQTVLREDFAFVLSTHVDRAMIETKSGMLTAAEASPLDHRVRIADPPEYSVLMAGDVSSNSDDQEQALGWIVLPAMFWCLVTLALISLTVAYMAEDESNGNRATLKVMGVATSTYVNGSIGVLMIILLPLFCVCAIVFGAYAESLRLLPPVLWVIVAVFYVFNCIMYGIMVSFLTYRSVSRTFAVLIVTTSIACFLGFGGMMPGLLFAREAAWSSYLGFAQCLGYLQGSVYYQVLKVPSPTPDIRSDTYLAYLEQGMSYAGVHVPFHKVLTWNAWEQRFTKDGAGYAVETPAAWTALLALIFNTGLTFLVTHYLSVVCPGPHGVSQSLLYFLSPGYWTGDPKEGVAGPSVAAELSGDAGAAGTDSYSGDRRIKQSLDRDINAETNRVLSLVSGHEAAPVLAVKVSKTYRSPTARWYQRGASSNIRAIDNVSFSAGRGECVVVLGHNASGKSTLISILAGLLGPTSGEAFVNRYSSSRCTYLVLPTIGCMPQANFALSGLSLLDNVRFFAQMRGVPSATVTQHARDLLEIVGLLKHEAKTDVECSGGMRRRLTFAIAMAGDPDVVFLDQPSSGCDVATRNRIWDVVRFLKSKGKAVVLTTNDMDEADALADKIVVLALGEVRGVGSPLHLRARHAPGWRVRVLEQHAESLSLTDAGRIVRPGAAARAAGDAPASPVLAALQQLLPVGREIEGATDRSGLYSIFVPTSKLVELQMLIRWLEAPTVDPALIKDWTVTMSSMGDVFDALTHGLLDSEMEQEDQLLADVPVAGDGAHPGRFTLSFAWASSPDILVGSINLLPTSTLEEVRHIVVDDGIVEGDAKWMFVTSNGPVPQWLERQCLATAVAPLATLQTLEESR